MEIFTKTALETMKNRKLAKKTAKQKISTYLKKGIDKRLLLVYNRTKEQK